MKNSVFVKKNARFTVMCDGVVRMEYAKDGKFINEETLFAKRGAETAKTVCDGDMLVIETDRLTLYYKGEDMFSPENLYADIHVGSMNVRWHFNDKNEKNLGGTLSTLDGVFGFRDLPDGLLSRDGWFVIDDTGKPVFSNGWIENRDESHVCDMYLFAYGSDYKSALADLAAVSGKMEMPRKYFLGSWYSRWWKYTADEFLQIIDEYDSHGFPIDILVIDMDWHYHDWGYTEGDPRPMFGYGHAGGNLGWTGYTWNRHVIPDPEGLIAELHKRGVYVTLNDHPCDGVRDHEAGYDKLMASLEENGYTEQVPDVEDKISDREREGQSRGVKNYRFNAGSRDYMNAFFESTALTMENAGADFRWLDWQQDYLYPFVNGVKDLGHLQWLNHLYYEFSRSGGKRGMSFSRWGGFGDHKHPAYFSGDSITDWTTLDFEIQMTVSAGNAGCFWWSHDIGGFSDPVKGGQAELYVRWVQFGAVSPALRLHVCGDIDRRPWKWGEPFCSAMKEMFVMRSRLMPYIYSSAYESYEKSIPLLRALYLEEPENEEAYKHPSEYYFGDGLLAAPIVRAGEGEDSLVTSEVWLPKGQWYGWFDEKRRNGDATVTETNSLYTFPLYVKAGYPVVTQPYRARMTSALLDDVTVKIFCGEGDICGEAVLFEDDGVSEGFKEDKCRKTSVKYEKCGGTHKITFDPTGKGYDGEVAFRRICIELADCDRVSEISGNGSGDGILQWDGESRKATVSLDNISATEKFSIVIS